MLLPPCRRQLEIEKLYALFAEAATVTVTVTPPLHLKRKDSGVEKCKIVVALQKKVPDSIVLLSFSVSAVRVEINHSFVSPSVL